MSLEIWKPINGFNSYSVSSWGRIRNEETGDVLHQQKHDKGYMRVDLYADGKRRHMKVHRLVAEAFVPNPEAKPHVNHKDGNNRNNSFTNLEWVTDAENKAKAVELRSHADRANKGDNNESVNSLRGKSRGVQSISSKGS